MRLTPQIAVLGPNALLCFWGIWTWCAKRFLGYLDLVCKAFLQKCVWGAMCLKGVTDHDILHYGTGIWIKKILASRFELLLPAVMRCCTTGGHKLPAGS